MGNKPKRAVTPWQRKRLAQMGTMLAVTVIMGVGLHVYIGSAASVAGTLLEVSESDAAAYGITQVYQLDDGTYRVEGSAKGFASEVVTTVILSADGTVQSVEVSAPGETENLGGQCMGEAFTAQFSGVAAPVTLNGKDFAVTDPATGAAYSTGEAQPEPEAEPFDPATWNAEDTSPEAAAMRALYSAGLTATAQKGEDLTTPWVDLSAEGKAEARLAQYELTVSKTKPTAQTAQASAELSGVDAVSGATLTSSAVANVVNGAYFYVRDVLAVQS